MDNILAGQEVTTKVLDGTFTVLSLNYDGSCVLIANDGKSTYTVHISTLTTVGQS